MQAMLRLLLLSCFLLGSALSRADTLTAGPLHVHYAPPDAALAQYSLEVLEEAVREFAPRLPLGEEPVHVTIAHTMDDFARLSGRPGNVHLSGIARSWEGTIVVKSVQLRLSGGDYRGTLRHELVHVLLYRNADTGVLPQWLNEGLCMMLANELHWQASLKVAQMFVRNRVIHYRDLNMALQFPTGGAQFSDAYAQSLSMTEFMRERYGEEALWRTVYATREMDFGDAMRTHMGVSPMEFWAAYRRSLWGLALIGSLVSGSVFTPIAILFLFVYLKKRRQTKRGFARLEAEERAAAGAPVYYTWEEILQDDPDAWKGEEDEEEDAEEWR